MPRRKNDYLSDGSDSDASNSAFSQDGYNSHEDQDARAERRLFELKGNKRRKTDGRSGKDAAWEGVFGEDDSVGGAQRRGGIGGRGRPGSSSLRTDWTKAPAFVSTGSKTLQEEEEEGLRQADADEPERDEDEDGLESSTSSESDSGSENDDGSSGVPSPRIRDADDYNEEEQTTGGLGLGFRNASRQGITDESTREAGQREEGGATDSFGRPPPSLTAHSGHHTQRRFLPRPQSPVVSSNKAHLTAAEKAHFSKIQSSFGARLLAKQGWEAGKGLGIQEDGRAVPIEVGKVMRGQGIQRGIRTEDSKREARRQGVTFSDDEDEEAPRRRRHREKGPKVHKEKSEEDQGWKRQKKVKVKVQHKTYEQLLAEAGDAVSAPGIGLVLDARGGELKEVQSLSSLSLSTWTPSSDSTRLAELRHNLHLIVDAAKQDVSGLVKEGKKVHERRRWALREEEISRAKAEEASTKWRPFDVSSDVLLSSLKTWKKAYNLPETIDNDTVVATLSLEDKNTTVDRVDAGGERVMTAWESLIWHQWVPKVRSAINNEWDPSSPNDAVHLVESWEPILPLFVKDNILDQLVLPKVKAAIEQWNPKRDKRERHPKSLASIVFPWLPLLGERIDEIMDLSKRRIRHVMRNWVVKDGVPEELRRWRKDVYSSNEWDKLIIQFVLPKLGLCLREDFTVNPRRQDMVPLQDWVLPWHTLIRQSMFSHLLEVEFFPKWLDVLYIWLIQPSYKANEVATWYQWWSERFPEEVRDTPGVKQGFESGLNLMQEAMDLGSDAATKLRKPKFEPRSTTKMLQSSTTPKLRKPEPPSTIATDITFRSIAEDYAAQHDLIFLPVGRSHNKTGKPLFKVCKNVEGRGGVTVYIGEHAVFANMDDGEFRAISLEDMVKKASA
ncbi:tuftelin-interacting protein 11 [Cryptococcus deuterogattii 99/473]|uniref:Tuftelin-interacting protein 11 n=1 Tax=Cryptococcus deuterogattii Ram5 TaxID=1296110 RepID=A0A0D0TQR8_9TREE|nr:tuftelin-interacting protein 11 [Cryptococcus deuterogattii Ram5]KIY56673.1 tuftelin-interacting protein 11 [Cryptococcus deuterogattii 99/473]